MTVDEIKKRRRKKRYFGLYTTGQINKLADGFLHPFFGQGDGSILLDSAIHAFVERDIWVSGRKFLRYSFARDTEKFQQEVQNQTKTI